MRTRLGLLGLLGALVAGGCGPTKESDPAARQPDEPAIPNTAPVPPATALDCPSGTRLTYENFGESMLLTYCNGCHSAHLDAAHRSGAPDQANFDRAADVALWRANILTRLNGSDKRMPPAATLSDAARKSMTEWLNCGAPSTDDPSRLP